MVCALGLALRLFRKPQRQMELADLNFNSRARRRRSWKTIQWLRGTVSKMSQILFLCCKRVGTAGFYLQPTVVSVSADQSQPIGSWKTSFRTMLVSRKRPLSSVGLVFPADAYLIYLSSLS
jgi:hypothetical protein